MARRFSREAQRCASRRVPRLRTSAARTDDVSLSEQSPGEPHAAERSARVADGQAETRAYIGSSFRGAAKPAVGRKATRESHLALARAGAPCRRRVFVQLLRSVRRKPRLFRGMGPFAGQCFRFQDSVALDIGDRAADQRARHRAAAIVHGPPRRRLRCVGRSRSETDRLAPISSPLAISRRGQGFSLSRTLPASGCGDNAPPSADSGRAARRSLPLDFFANAAPTRRVRGRSRTRVFRFPREA